MKKSKEVQDKIGDERLKELFGIVEKTLNRNGNTAAKISKTEGVSVVLVNRIAGMLRKAGRDIPKQRWGMKRVLEDYLQEEQYRARNIICKIGIKAEPQA